MDELEKEFFKAMVGFDYRESDGDILVEQIDDAKAAASLCREREKRIISLAQQTILEGQTGIIKMRFTEQEILDTLNKKP